MNAILDLLTRRRSVPPLALGAPGPTPEQTEQLLRIAARVPDHGKLAPWRFIVLEGEGRGRAGEVVAAAFAKANPQADADQAAQQRAVFSHAPLIVVVVSRAAPHVKIPEWEQVLSSGAVCMNLTAAAVGMGFRTAWLTGWAAYNADVAAGLGLAGHEKIAGFIHIGSSSMQPEDRVRPDMAEIVTCF